MKKRRRTASKDSDGIGMVEGDEPRGGRRKDDPLRRLCGCTLSEAADVQVALDIRHGEKITDLNGAHGL